MSFTFLLSRRSIHTTSNSIMMKQQQQQQRNVFGSVVRNTSRGMATEASPFYKYVLQSNASYVTFVLVGATIFGGTYSLLGDYLWESVNRGRLYHQIDWSKWNSKWQ
jgi:hypothetical protein